MRISLLLSLCLATGCATQQPAASSSGGYGPNVSCEGDGVRVLFDELHPSAFIFEGDALLAAVPCGGTRIRGANFACGSGEVQIFYESVDRPAWILLRGKHVTLTCHPGVAAACGSSRRCICRGSDRLVRVDATTRTAQLCATDRPAVDARCVFVASAGVDTRCIGQDFSLEFDSHDWRRARLTEPSGDTELRCAPELRP